MTTRSLLVILWLSLVIGGMAVGHQYRSLKPVQTQRQQGDIMLDAFGEFRTVLARYLWFKMDLFHEVLDEQGVPHEKQTELLPLVRIISLLDPSIVDSYDNIAWDLYKGHGDWKQALAIVNEGIEKNPESVQLYLRKAMICHHEKLFSEALESAQQAVQRAEDEFDTLNSLRLVYWSAKALKDKETALDALDKLSKYRPDDTLWKTERAAILSTK